MKFNVKTVCVMVLTALMTLISCGGNDHEPNGKTTPKPDVKPTETVTKYVGGDISLLPEYEKARAIFKDKGTAVAPLVLFKKVGWNAMRLRLFVNPDQYKGADRDPNACQNLAYILPLASNFCLISITPTRGLTPQSNGLRLPGQGLTTVNWLQNSKLIQRKC